MRETQVWSLGQEDPLEKGMAIHSSILACRIPWADPGRSQSMELQTVGHDWATNTHTHTYTHRSQQAAGRNLFVALDPARVGKKAQFSTKFSALSWWCPVTSELNCFQSSLAPSLTSRCRLSRPALTTPWLLISWSFFFWGGRGLWDLCPFSPSSSPNLVARVWAEKEKREAQSMGVRNWCRMSRLFIGI